MRVTAASGLSHSGFQNDLTLGGKVGVERCRGHPGSGACDRDLDNAAQTMTLSIDRRLTDELTFEASARWWSVMNVIRTARPWRATMPVIASVTYSF